MTIITHRRTLTLAAAAITLAILTGGASGCPTEKGAGTGGTVDGNGGGTMLKSCATKITQQPSRVGRGRTIEAKTHSDCKPVTPVKHTVFVTVQYHPINSDTYVTMGTKYCEAKPVPGIPTDCHVSLPGVCRVGVWRMRVQITGSMPNGTSFAFVVPNKRTVKIRSCS